MIEYFSDTARQVRTDVAAEIARLTVALMLRQSHDDSEYRRGQLKGLAFALALVTPPEDGAETQRT